MQTSVLSRTHAPEREAELRAALAPLGDIDIEASAYEVLDIVDPAGVAAVVDTLVSRANAPRIARAYGWRSYEDPEWAYLVFVVADREVLTAEDRYRLGELTGEILEAAIDSNYREDRVVAEFVSFDI